MTRGHSHVLVLNALPKFSFVGTSFFSLRPMGNTTKRLSSIPWTLDLGRSCRLQTTTQLLQLLLPLVLMEVWFKDYD